MKFTVHFKTPDAIHHALDGMSDEDKEKALEFSKKFITWGEAISIEFDTDADTAVVV